MKIRYREVLISIATALVAYVGANAIEHSFIQAFTDGISEALPIEADSLPEFLRGTILRQSPDQNPRRICESILKLVNRVSEPISLNDCRDDQTVLAFLVDSNS